MTQNMVRVGYDFSAPVPRKCQLCQKQMRYTRDTQKFCSAKCRLEFNYPHLKNLVSIAEAARLSKRSYSTIRRRVESGSLASYEVGNRKVIHRWQLGV